MKTKPEKEEDSKILPLSSVRVGDVELTSHYSNISDLCGYVLWLLQQKEVKEYLDLIKKKKAFGGSNYLG